MEGHFWPVSLTPISPLLGNRGSRIYFSFRGAYSDYLVAKTYQGTPYGGSLKIRDFQKKFGVPEHGVLRGLPSSEWHTKFFERLGRKNPTHFFIFSNFDPRAELCPPENGPIFDVF